MAGRRRRLQEIAERIGRRRLAFFGTRGADSRPLLEFMQFSDCICLVAPLAALSMPNECCLETISRVRVDLNSYHTDVDKSEEARMLHQALLQACDEPSVLMTYRTAEFLTSVYFPRMEITQYLGVFDGLTTMLEHKPFVETSLREAKISVIDWRYFADEDMPRLAEAIGHGPHVLRVNRSSGGKGLTLARTPEELRTILPSHCDRFLGAAPFLDPNIPLNIGACVFADGSVTLHSPSLQLIGLDCCTARQFGYCGNDWARVRDLDGDVLDSLEEMALSSGHWLHSMGYVGAFGIDAILHQGQVFLSEINVRFQGSSAVSAELDCQMDIPDIYSDHMAAFLNLSAPPLIHVRDLVREQPATSQVICYNRNSTEVVRGTNQLDCRTSYLLDLLPSPGIRVAQEGILFKVVVNGPVTNDGHTLPQSLRSELGTLQTKLFTTIPTPG